MKSVADLVPQIAIFTDDPGWHGRELINALAQHGLGASYLSLTECEFRFDDAGLPVHLPGFEVCYPIGVFVRGVPGGTLEQVIHRLDILHALAQSGVTVYNEPRAIERTVDKAMTTFLLKQAGLPTPATWVFESVETAVHIYEKETAAGRSLLMKPLFGSQGLGIQRLSKETPMLIDETFAGVYYLQSFVERKQTGWSDIRVFVIAGKAIAAMRRSGQHWITNRAQGASCECLPLDRQLSDLAEAAVDAVAIDYAGVDLLIDTQGQLQIIEVNSIPAWWGLQSVTDFNIAAQLIDHFVSKIARRQPLISQS